MVRSLQCIYYLLIIFNLLKYQFNTNWYKLYLWSDNWKLYRYEYVSKQELSEDSDARLYIFCLKHKLDQKWKTFVCKISFNSI